MLQDKGRETAARPCCLLWERCGNKTVFFPCLCLSDLDSVGQEQRNSFIQACNLLWCVSFEYLSSWIKPYLTYNEFSSHFIHLKKPSSYSFQPKERSCFGNFKVSFGDWRDGSPGKVPATQAWWPEFRSLAPYKTWAWFYLSVILAKGEVWNLEDLLRSLAHQSSLLVNSVQRETLSHEDKMVSNSRRP